METKKRPEGRGARWALLSFVCLNNPHGRRPSSLTFCWNHFMVSALSILCGAPTFARPFLRRLAGKRGGKRRKTTCEREP